MKVNDFRADLSFSLSQSAEPFWEFTYRAFFDGFQKMQSTGDDMAMQRAGIDRVVYLSSGQRVKIDEKIRREAYPDILIEHLSNDKTGALGWIFKPLAIDFLAYAFLPTRKVYMLDWHALKRAWKTNGEAWKAKYKTVSARNSGYNTISTAIPTDVLCSAMVVSSIVSVSPEIPTP